MKQRAAVSPQSAITSDNFNSCLYQVLIYGNKVFYIYSEERSLKK